MNWKLFWKSGIRAIKWFTLVCIGLIFAFFIGVMVTGMLWEHTHIFASASTGIILVMWFVIYKYRIGEKDED